MFGLLNSTCFLAHTHVCAKSGPVKATISIQTMKCLFYVFIFSNDEINLIEMSDVPAVSMSFGATNEQYANSAAGLVVDVGPLVCGG